MDWTPIQKNELATHLQEELEKMSSDLKGKFAAIQTPLYQVPCDRGGSYSNEKIFVLGSTEDKILVFDDVEDEYGVADRLENPGTMLHQWQLYGALETALNSMGN